jgi:hypothetical protein
MEFIACAMILGGVGFLASPGIISAGAAGKGVAVLLGLCVLGLGGFGLVLGLFGMLKVQSQRAPGLWYVLTALVLSGLAVVSGLTMFIGAMAR